MKINGFKSILTPSVQLFKPFRMIKLFRECISEWKLKYLSDQFLICYYLRIKVVFAFNLHIKLRECGRDIIVIELFVYFLDFTHLFLGKKHANENDIMLG